MTIIIRAWEGRLGNQIIQIQNAIQVALYFDHNVLIMPHNEFLLNNKLILSKNHKNNYITFTTPHNFFVKFDLKTQLCFDKNIDKTIFIMRKLFTLTQKNIKPFDNNCVVIHLRSGDLFKKYLGQGTEKYVCPPFIFYENILKEKNFKTIYLICQDNKHPLLKLFIQKYPNIIFNVQSLKKDIDIILRAQNIILSIGTFVSSLLLFSDHIREVYGTKYHINKINKKFIKCKIHKYDYKLYYNQQGSWLNTISQRKRMIEWRNPITTS